MAHHDDHRDRRSPQAGADDRDGQEDLDRARQRDPIHLPGDNGEDRNPSRFSAYETRAEEADVEDIEDIDDINDINDINDIDDIDDIDDPEDPDDLDDEGRIFLDDNR